MSINFRYFTLAQIYVHIGEAECDPCDSFGFYVIYLLYKLYSVIKVI